MGIYVSYQDIATVLLAFVVLPALYYGIAYGIDRLIWLVRLLRR